MGTIGDDPGQTNFGRESGGKMGTLCSARVKLFGILIETLGTHGGGPLAPCAVHRFPLKPRGEGNHGNAMMPAVLAGPGKVKTQGSWGGGRRLDGGLWPHWLMEHSVPLVALCVKAILWKTSLAVARRWGVTWEVL